MSKRQTGEERMEKDLSKRGFREGQIGRIITRETTQGSAGEEVEMEAVGERSLSKGSRGREID